jgi:hypothetical protein
LKDDSTDKGDVDSLNHADYLHMFVYLSYFAVFNKPIKNLIMKKFVLALSLMATSLVGFSQEVRLNLYSGYVFNDAVDSRFDAFNYYAGTVKGAFQWGAGMEFMVAPKTGVEASFQRMNTTLPLTYYKTGAQSSTFDLNMNHLMLGVNRYFRGEGSMAEFYTGAQAGLMIGNWKNPATFNNGTMEKFSWGAKAGLNIWPMSNLGIKLQGQMQSSYQAIGSKLYSGTGGSGAGLATASSLYQFGMVGGIIFRFPEAK